MSQTLIPLRFPLHGSRLIEASAGTGKTWTIAALYVRLVLGHGADATSDANLGDEVGGEMGGTLAYARALVPSEILVMTFTRAATRELSERVRTRLVEAAHCFRGRAPQADDHFLQELIADYPNAMDRQGAAHRLMMAAEAMDECAIFTIDAWCQRMLREHAFDSGCLFDEELVSNEASLYQDALRDYWRQQVYPLNQQELTSFIAAWPHLDALEAAVRPLLAKVRYFAGADTEGLGSLIARVSREQIAAAHALKAGWSERADRMQAWLVDNKLALSGTILRASTVSAFFIALRAWVDDARAILPPDGFAKGCDKLHPEKLILSVKNGASVTPSEDFAQLAELESALATLEPLKHVMLRHAASQIALRQTELKLASHQFGFQDLLTRLRTALEGPNGATLIRRITEQYPIALIDEFQDTAPEQYRIFDLLYQIKANAPTLGLFLIGDPKQAIYGFRGADIRCYLEARAATTGRHYVLATNFRSSLALVTAVNQIFLHAEGTDSQPGHPGGAFGFRRPKENPLPFEAVLARGRNETLVDADGPLAALTIWCNPDPELKADSYLSHFAATCAEHIVTLLNDAQLGFQEGAQFTRLKPADIAVLVRDRKEAKAVRRALQQRHVASVYLSDKDSVFKSGAASDMLSWLTAIANPLVARLARAAFATRSTGLTLAELAHLAVDDLAWEARLEQLKRLRAIWQRQGVLAMCRRFIHDLGLPASLLSQAGGERQLTDLLHLAELLQSASQQLDGEQALIRWLAERIVSDDGEDEHIVRLESDAELVQVITVHKSKGLEYPLVFLPFAVSAKPVTRQRRSFFESTDAHGAHHIDFAMSEASNKLMEAARREEDVRLLYVALTRARHALYLGVSSIANKIQVSAFGYLLGGDTAISQAQLMTALEAMRAGCAALLIQPAVAAPASTKLARPVQQIPLRDTALFQTKLERDWRIASYTSLTRDLGSVALAPTPITERLIELSEDEQCTLPGKRQDTAWHRFPRGALPGQFLHEQLESVAIEGFSQLGQDSQSEQRLRARCERAGWGQRSDDVVLWLTTVVNTTLPPLGAALCELDTVVPELEFWFPADGLATKTLDALCQTHLLDALPRPPLSERQLKGMLRGYQDLVFEHAGRYWVLDYKSNALANGDGGYHHAALADGMAAARYDVQGTLYLFALHRLLKSRLGDAYTPATHLGGALFYFIRGVAHPETHGCYHLPADPTMLAALDQLMPMTPSHQEAA